MRLSYACKGAQVVFAYTPQARLGIDLGGREVVVSQELLHLINGHPGIERDRGDAHPEAVRRHLLAD